MRHDIGSFVQEHHQSTWIICAAMEMKSHCFNAVIMEWGFIIVEAQMEQVYCAIMVNSIYLHK